MAKSISLTDRQRDLLSSIKRMGGNVLFREVDGTGPDGWSGETCYSLWERGDECNWDSLNKDEWTDVKHLARCGLIKVSYHNKKSGGITLVGVGENND